MSKPEAEIAELPTDPGARLRRQRELAALTEQEVAERLNLDVVAVQALEADDYATLGAPVFVRGHIRRYASLLGLPSEEILGAYDRSRARLAPPTLVPKSRAEMAAPRRRVIPSWVGAGALALLAAACIAAYLARFGPHLPDMGSAGVTGIAAGPEAPRAAGAAVAAPGPDTPAGAAASPPPGESATLAAEPVAAAPPGQVGLLFEFAADSWIEVYDAKGRTVLYDLGKAGTAREVTGVAPLSVTLGNAPAVALSVNGRRVAVPAPTSSETVARFGVVADGLQR